MSYVWPFIGLSAVLLIGGLTAFGYYGNKGQLLGHRLCRRPQACSSN